MTIADLGVAILLLMATLLCVLASALFLQRPLWSRNLRLPLFTIRDRLVWLVAEGTLTEDDEVFQFLYRNLNAIIPIVRPMRFSAFIRSIEHAEMSTENDDQFRVMLSCIGHKDEAVRSVARDLFTATFKILLRDVFVRLAFHGVVRSSVGAVVRKSTNRFAGRQQAYRIARRMETASKHLQLRPV
jgi:hypothetical protein